MARLATVTVGYEVYGEQDEPGIPEGKRRAHEPMIRMLEHTADVGFEVAKAPTLEDLFDGARRALLMVMLGRPPEEGEREESLRISAPDLETLLVRWINELAFLVQDGGIVPAGADLRIGEGVGEGFYLDARLAGSPLDLESQGWQGEVKSATFHGLDVTHEDEGWWARVILDV